jgi:hypothetical protein
MDYKAELERLKSNPVETGYWSPEPGQYRVKALSEIEESEPFEDDSDQKPRKKLKISVLGKEQIWTFPFGKKESSIYGQLVNLGAHKGKVLGEEFTIVVVGKDQDRRYTIVL